MAARQGRTSRARRGGLTRRRLVGFGILVLIAGTIGFVLANAFERGYRELALPLRHDDIIRQQARDKGLDPALIAAVIYQESRFRPRESGAGAQGLMQILPETANFIARRSGGTRFTTKDLATPQVNIAYGSYYLKYLLDRYGGDTPTALAAYNAGEGRVDQWLRDAGHAGGRITDVDSIPIAETRDYVKAVLKARDQYKREYAAELSI